MRQSSYSSAWRFTSPCHGSLTALTGPQDYLGPVETGKLETAAPLALLFMISLSLCQVGGAVFVLQMKKLTLAESNTLEVPEPVVSGRPKTDTQVVSAA